MSADLLDEMPTESRQWLVEQLCTELDIDAGTAEDLIRSAEPLWNAMERAGGLVDSWGGGEFCALLPRVLAFVRGSD
ncbi:hypothetical protein [Nocardioides sp. NPDC006273]|uniref:hypothetical protein n=1 Tax=Nocardioides sp. NPDC006273 TaxID=3155598 RepID=UPI0033A5341E